MRAHRAFSLLLVVSACTANRVPPTARAVFGQFQDALFAGDRTALRGLLSRESRAVIPQLPFERIRDQAPLCIVGSERRDPEIHLRVRDPNRDDRESTYVLVQEDGQLRVDLIATTAFNHESRPVPGSGPQLLPRRLRPEELAEELARISAR